MDGWMDEERASIGYSEHTLEHLDIIARLSPLLSIKHNNFTVLYVHYPHTYTNLRSFSGDEWNFLLLGVIMMIGMGAIVACVRCRRQKRGFEVHFILTLTLIHSVPVCILLLKYLHPSKTPYSHCFCCCSINGSCSSFSLPLSFVLLFH